MFIYIKNFLDFLHIMRDAGEIISVGIFYNLNFSLDVPQAFQKGGRVPNRQSILGQTILIIYTRTKCWKFFFSRSLVYGT